MSTTTLTAESVEVDEQGFLLNPDQWTPEIATEIARDAGIDPMTERHWEVIDFCRRDYATTGQSPTVRRITKQTGIPTKEMYQLFPKGPGILAAKIAGLSKPKGCI